MINFNGNILTDKDSQLQVSHRAIAYGDALFETLKVEPNHTICFWEAHYFRLTASMRILRMKIPRNFTPEFLESEIKKTIESNGIPKTATLRVKLTIYRDAEGLYLPNSREIGYFISVSKINANVQNNAYQEVTLFKDYYLAPGLLSTVKTTNKLLHVLSSIFAEENNFDNALILNTDKKVVEVSNGNLFLVTKANEIVTAPLSDGCINGVFRKQLLEVASKNTDIKVVERSISPFELQKANELFVTNVIRGITPILKYKKKTFETTWSTKLTEMINNTYQTQYPL